MRIQYPSKKFKFKVKKFNKLEWPWVFNKKFFQIKNINLNEIDYLIYCHAFTDGLLSSGFDGFIRMDDWLMFTIDHLLKRNKKILVKIHPNFHKYNNHFRSKYEIIIFNKIKNSYKNNPNVIFIDYPVSNFDIMKKLDRKKTILITHHGTPILESVAKGFKIISSTRTHWSNKFKLSNSWSNKKEYKKILNKEYNQLRNGSTKDLQILFSLIFKNNYGVHGKKYFVKILTSNKNQKYLNNIKNSIEEL